MLTIAEPITIDAFWDYVAQHPLEAGYYELNRGVIEMAGGTGGRHGTTTIRVSAPIHTFVEQRSLGICTAAETCYVLSAEEAIIRCPDFAFIRAERVPNPIPDGFVPLAPDFA
ncbi:MAG: Uma2 family endonuclease, partial [Anaerolineae bacterium]|nr:Uma2 family endonuclease [Anaerolineae bacterium]MDW8173565.1 Uma2 family endonuclease [Anaerolineae bacterium]